MMFQIGCNVVKLIYKLFYSINSISVLIYHDSFLLFQNVLCQTETFGVPLDKIQWDNHIISSPPNPAYLLQNLRVEVTFVNGFQQWTWQTYSFSVSGNFFHKTRDIVLLLVIIEWNTYLRDRMVYFLLVCRAEKIIWVQAWYEKYSAIFSFPHIDQKIKKCNEMIKLIRRLLVNLPHNVLFKI